MFIEKRLIYRLSRPQIHDLNPETDSKDRIIDTITNNKEGVAQLQATLKEQIAKPIDPQHRFIDVERAHRYLEEIKNKANPKRLQEIQAEITDRQQNVAELISTISQSRFKIKGKSLTDLQSQDLNLDMFITLNPEEQKTKLKSLSQNLEDIIEQCHSLLNFFDEINPEVLTEFINTNTQKRQNKLTEYKSLDTKFKTLLKQASLPETKATLERKRFQEHGIEGRKFFLERLENNLKQNETVIEFKEADKKRQLLYPDFHISSQEKKQQILAKIRDTIQEEYTNKLRKHKYYQYLSRIDEKIFESTFQENNGKFSITTAEICLKWLDTNMQQIYEVYKESQQFSNKTLQHFKFDELNYFEKLELMKPKGKLATYEEKQEHITLDNAYKSKLEKYLNHKPLGLINQEGFDSYAKWFSNLELKKKTEIINFATTNKHLDFLDATQTQREKAIKQFLKLDKHIQAEYKDQFINSGFEERTALLIEIHEKKIELNDIFQEKLEQSIENKLLTLKSKKRYQQLFAKLTLKEQEQYLNNCNLDKKERKELVTKFEIEILSLVPSTDKKRISTEFYNADFKLRKKLLIQYKLKYKPKNKNEKELIKAKYKVHKLEQKTAEPETKDAVLYKSYLKTADKFANGTLEQKTLGLNLYSELLDMDINLTEQQIKVIQDKQEKLSEEVNINNKIQSGLFQEMISFEVQKIIQTNPAIMKEQHKLTILEEAGKLLTKNEKYYKPENFQNRMQNSLEDAHTKSINEDFQDTTDNVYSLYVDQWNEVEVGTEIKLDIESFETSDQLQYWMDYFSDMQDLPPEDQSDPRFTVFSSKNNIALSAKRFQKETLDPAKFDFINDYITPKLFDKLEIKNPDLQKRTLDTILASGPLTSKLPKTTADELSA